MGTIDIYSEFDHVCFVPPMFIVHTGRQRSLTLKVNLQRFVEKAADPCRAQLSLLNRSFNRAMFLRNMRDLLLDKKLSLSAVSKLWMKINSVYKQASIERNSIRKKA